jgi:hypothetical protein
MSSTCSGRCLCGQVTYEYVGSVGPANYCHCEDCRRCTGSAFNIGVRFRLADFRIVSGDPKGFTKQADSGRELTRYFCPECGSPLFTSAPKHPDFIYVKAGTLDDSSLVKPAEQHWVSSRVPWSRILPDLRGLSKGSDSPAVGLHASSASS